MERGKSMGEALTFFMGVDVGVWLVVTLLILVGFSNLAALWGVLLVLLLGLLFVKKGDKKGDN